MRHEVVMFRVFLEAMYTFTMWLWAVAGILARAVICRVTGLCGDQRGASIVEYALLVALIAVVAIGGIILLGTRVSAMFETIGGLL